MSNISESLFAAFAGELAPDADPTRLGGLISFIEAHLETGKPDRETILKHLEEYSEKVLQVSEDFEARVGHIPEGAEVPPEFSALTESIESAFASHLEGLEILTSVLCEEPPDELEVQEAVSTLHESGSELEGSIDIFVNFGSE